MEQTRNGSRKRAFAHKRRTGCDVCKLKRVRCDEQKPTCIRCNKSGFDCTYYNVPNPRAFSANLSGLSKQKRPWTRPGIQGNSSPHRDRLSILLHPSNTWATSPDISLIQYYIEQAAPTVANFAPIAQVWTEVVPRLAFQDKAVECALSAVSAGYLVFLGDYSKEKAALTHVTRTMQTYTRQSGDALVALIISHIFAVIYQATGDFTNARLHEQANYSISEGLECKTQSERDILGLIVTAQRMFINHTERSNQGQLYGRQIERESVEIRRQVEIIRQTRRKFENWLFSHSKARWDAFDTHARWALVAARSVMATAWNLWFELAEAPMDVKSADHVGIRWLRDRHDLRKAGKTTYSATSERLDEALIAVISLPTDSKVDGDMLRTRLQRFNDAFVDKVLDLLELYRTVQPSLHNEQAVYNW